MPELLFWVGHTPIPQPRPAIMIRGPFAGRAYVPKKHRVHAYRAAVANAATQALVELGEGPVECGVELWATFYLPRPNRLKRKKDPEGPFPHTRKPDADNLLKSTLDGLIESSALMIDDRNIAILHATKLYEKKAGGAGALIRLFWPLRGEQHELTIARTARQVGPGP